MMRESNFDSPVMFNVICTNNIVFFFFTEERFDMLEDYRAFLAFYYRS